jgi:guanylate kinase
MFPQDANLNTGAYKTLENELADWIRKGCDVNIDIKLQNFENGRPAEIEVSYNVVDPQSGKQVHKRGALFKNEGNQSFNRTAETEMSNKIAAARR